MSKFGRVVARSKCLFVGLGESTLINSTGWLLVAWRWGAAKERQMEIKKSRKGKAAEWGIDYTGTMAGWRRSAVQSCDATPSSKSGSLGPDVVYGKERGAPVAQWRATAGSGRGGGGGPAIGSALANRFSVIDRPQWLLSGALHANFQVG